MTTMLFQGFGPTVQAASARPFCNAINDDNFQNHPLCQTTVKRKNKQD
jgi:hypothetical protein